jgi:mannosyltransferase
MPLPSSFWLDEMATVFVARYGPAHWSLADVAPQAWQSVYYPVARISAAWFGSSEVAYRLPSVLLMAGALFLIARLATRLIHPQAGWFAVFACLTLGGINYEAADARPYAMGMCVAAAAMLCLVRWFDYGSWRDGLLFVLLAALLWRVHLLFWPIYLVFAAYAVARKTRRARTVLLFAAAAVLLVPVLIDALALARDASAHAFAPAPRLRDLISSLKLTLVAGCMAGAWLLARWRGWRGAPKSSVPAAVLILGWWLCTPVAFFLVSGITVSSLFVPRYLSIALPGAALAATLGAARWVPPDRWRPLGMLLGTVALLWLGHWQQLWPLHHNSDWRAAARAVNAAVGPNRLPVLCPSPFVEAQPPRWRPEYRLPGFLYSHLDVYPIAGQPVLLPYRDYPHATQMLAGIQPSGRFLIYGWEPQAHFWRDWLAARPEFTGWSARRLGPFADVDVVMFERR